VEQTEEPIPQPHCKDANCIEKPNEHKTDEKAVEEAPAEEEAQTLLHITDANFDGETAKTETHMAETEVQIKDPKCEDKVVLEARKEAQQCDEAVAQTDHAPSTPHNHKTRHGQSAKEAKKDEIASGGLKSVKTEPKNFNCQESNVAGASCNNASDTVPDSGGKESSQPASGKDNKDVQLSGICYKTGNPLLDEPGCSSWDFLSSQSDLDLQPRKKARPKHHHKRHPLKTAPSKFSSSLCLLKN
jgi:hypothetical protein